MITSDRFAQDFRPPGGLLRSVHRREVAGEAQVDPHGTWRESAGRTSGDLEELRHTVRSSNSVEKATRYKKAAGSGRRPGGLPSCFGQQAGTSQDPCSIFVGR